MVSVPSRVRVPGGPCPGFSPGPEGLCHLPNHAPAIMGGVPGHVPRPRLLPGPAAEAEEAHLRVQRRDLFCRAGGEAHQMWLYPLCVGGTDQVAPRAGQQSWQLAAVWASLGHIAWALVGMGPNSTAAQQKAGWSHGHPLWKCLAQTGTQYLLDECVCEVRPRKGRMGALSASWVWR